MTFGFRGCRYESWRDARAGSLRRPSADDGQLVHGIGDDRQVPLAIAASKEA